MTAPFISNRIECFSLCCAPIHTSAHSENEMRKTNVHEHDINRQIACIPILLAECAHFLVWTYYIPGSNGSNKKSKSAVRQFYLSVLAGKIPSSQQLVISVRCSQIIIIFIIGIHGLGRACGHIFALASVRECPWLHWIGWWCPFFFGSVA